MRGLFRLFISHLPWVLLCVCLVMALGGLRVGDGGFPEVFLPGGAGTPGGGRPVGVGGWVAAVKTRNGGEWPNPHPWL